ncbi:MAG: 23S rRNA (guanosine2251-2'-O)-methyltransferase [Saprospiraceae bacterium]|jgi:tRNA G18 (ribose-2'-O)-methylase SpoU
MKKLKLHELGRVSVEEYREVKKVPLIVVLDNIRSAMNVGSIFRTSDAMSISKIYLCGISATPPNREITKTAIGATDSVEWQYFESTNFAINCLKAEGYEVLAIEQTDSSVELMNYQPSKDKVAIVLGNEVNGVDSELLPLLDGAIEIDQYGTKHSLNVSVCGGIVIHHLSGMLRK